MTAAPTWTQADLWGLFDLHDLADGGLSQYLSASLARCASWFRASGASLFLAEQPFGPYHLRAKTGALSSMPDDAFVEMGKGIAGMAVLDGKARIIGDPKEDPSLAEIHIERRTNVISSMVVPLTEPSGMCIGVLNLSRNVGEVEFRAGDLKQARALGSHLALAISNGRLVGRLQSVVEDTFRANERLRGVLDSVNGAVLIVDSTGKISDRNSKAAALMCRTCELESMTQEAHLKVLAEPLKLALNEGRPVSKRIYDQAGDRTWLLNASPLTDGGCVLMVQEITEHERAQREVHRVRRLAEIGQMAAAIAHEIRNPLTGIRAAGQMVGAHPEMGKELGEIIENEALKLNDLCNEFLDFARPMQLKVDEASLSEVVSRMWPLLTADFVGSDILARLEIGSEDPIIQMDRRRIEQVLHNLVRNARQACKAGGEVTVKVGNGFLEVSDTGVGMDDETKERLFVPFFTTKSNGTGLGLCNVRKIVEAHGGTIRVDSQPGAGSRFLVRFERSVA
jgi:signal transduction histidine kinase